ncbi:hypothetical protein BpHYR1_033151 [Brachionus plicatilis]|uniref:Uncharacterized protein n=1 Tax=Brachionus plicatilis TaxID=10195 RepID=A0A3M7QMD5_BRAPC|nr:hypothetical protein BpHYR1_033151 [Brachionus plicatilis]
MKVWSEMIARNKEGFKIFPFQIQDHQIPHFRILSSFKHIKLRNNKTSFQWGHFHDLNQCFILVLVRFERRQQCLASLYKFCALEINYNIGKQRSRPTVQLFWPIVI